MSETTNTTNLVSGQLYRFRANKLVLKVSEANLRSLNEQPVDFITINKGEIVMVISSSLSVNRKQPYYKVFFLAGEEIIYYGDDFSRFQEALEFIQ